jgi:hypothetical protein
MGLSRGRRRAMRKNSHRASTRSWCAQRKCPAGTGQSNRNGIAPWEMPETPVRSKTTNNGRATLKPRDGDRGERIAIAQLESRSQRAGNCLCPAFRPTCARLATSSTGLAVRTNLFFHLVLRSPVPANDNRPPIQSELDEWPECFPAQLAKSSNEKGLMDVTLAYAIVAVLVVIAWLYAISFPAAAQVNLRRRTALLLKQLAGQFNCRSQPEG